MPCPDYHAKLSPADLSRRAFRKSALWERLNCSCLMTLSNCPFVEVPGCLTEARFAPQMGRRRGGLALDRKGGYTLKFETGKRQILKDGVVLFVIVIVLPYTIPSGL